VPDGINLGAQLGHPAVEMLNLEKIASSSASVPMNGNWGDLVIQCGLKRRARKRVLNINAEAKEVLEQFVMESKGRHVFSRPRHPDKKLEPWVLESQMARLRDKIKIDPDVGLHTLRHTFLTEAGEDTDAFTLQYIAGHDTIKTTMCYVHPRAESVSRAFGRINRRKKPARSA
jgi:integrase/recombinase XerD